MGVDIYIKPESFANCQEAECKVFRPGFPLEAIAYSGDTLYHPGSRIIPLKFVPRTYRLQVSELEEAKQTDPAQFAVRIRVVPEKDGFTPPSYFFENWVTEVEFLELRAQISPRARPTWHRLGLEEREEICRYCPLNVFNNDCMPRLFGYGRLPALRRATRQVFSNPPDLIKDAVDELLKTFRQVSPLAENGQVEDGTNTLNAERKARWLANSFQDEGIQFIQGSEIVERPFNATVANSEEILDRLIFREDEDHNMHYLSGEQLKTLVGWVGEVLVALKKLKENKLFDADLEDMLDIFETYHKAAVNTVNFNLEFSVSS